MKILLVEDEPKTAQSLKQGLEEIGYSVDIADTGFKGLKLAGSHLYELIITDLMIPGIDGLVLCKLLREKGNQVPIIMLTALGTTEDKVVGFDSGADDYLTKPFEFEELLARIRAVTKRVQLQIGSQSILTFADLSMNLHTREVTRGGIHINLTAKEFSLLEYLIRNQGRVVSKVDIAEKIWDITFDTGTNVIEVYVSYLRTKIDKDFPKKLIHTRIGMGYVLKEE